jgi:hypothetical protein
LARSINYTQVCNPCSSSSHQLTHRLSTTRTTKGSKKKSERDEHRERLMTDGMRKIEQFFPLKAIQDHPTQRKNIEINK